MADSGLTKFLPAWTIVVTNVKGYKGNAEVFIIGAIGVIDVAEKAESLICEKSKDGIEIVITKMERREGVVYAG